MPRARSKIVVVTDEPEKYEVHDVARGSRRRHGAPPRRARRVQRELREITGCTVIIYDQTCATEKRRRRKRGTMVDPAKRVVINELVCEGCGDCSVQSNCLSVEPVETEFGRKRRINQNTCNKDYSCVKGFCPSFVTVEGGQLKSAKKARAERPHLVALPPLPEPALPLAADERLGHRRRRRRRHRRHHDRPAARHGRAPRGQGHRHAGRGRPRAEGRRDLEPHPDREPARRDPHDQGRHRRGRPRDRLRPDRRRQQGDARRDARRPHLRRAQHARHADRGVRAATPTGSSRPATARRRSPPRPAPDHVGGSMPTARRAAARRLDLHQPADAGLRLAAGPRAALRTPR